MYWRIDRDYLDLGDLGIESRVGTGQGSKDSAVGPIVRFRILDDDREIYYGGEGDDESLEVAFDFAQHDAGSTILQTKDAAGEWKDCIS